MILTAGFEPATRGRDHCSTVELCEFIYYVTHDRGDDIDCIDGYYFFNGCVGCVGSGEG